ncbi:MAG: Pyridoxine/pyridoxamine 5'-phosphate oxidase [Fimbriimonadaceae bacterium]|nr:Pyridoxine/pyridoxamine 5'-phosphate oxidase [Fimbriimonadaceae bacterium]
MSDAFLGQRDDYAHTHLDREDLADNPLVQLRSWLVDASVDPAAIEPNGFHLATVGPDGRPSGRVLLLRGLDHGLVFFSNTNSRKGIELATNPWAAATFWWASQERQVRIEGRVAPIAAEESDRYFAGRPLPSQAASTVSPQSQVIDGRGEMESEMARLIAAHPEGLPRPPHWGGYRLTPDRFEFWQGRPARLHDRFRYRLEGQTWMIERLAP